MRTHRFHVPAFFARALAGITLAVAAVGCSSPHVQRVTWDQFTKLPPFEGQVLIIERIPWPDNFVPTSISGPHFRITIEKDDGTRVSIERVETHLGSPLRMLEHLAGSRRTYPGDLIKDLR